MMNIVIGLAILVIPFVALHRVYRAEDRIVELEKRLDLIEKRRESWIDVEVKE